ncbi:Putative DNA-invertase from lambdoid prophage Rac [uncultured Clostridium sp.]|uniref:recombinase family protein n=1 Tax=uncultured Clostridium sp. TaxID=59620 RepID=UPI0008214FB4|nr:recombinase family protein [uncultured Clostridium sp.]SCK03387.1 Putative DNA-invertase from lambdoid prophage Rac [uncultured Clostridium sp.]
MNYGYARVSTIKQGHGNSLEEQLSQLFESGCDEVVEETYSGRTNDRPQLKLLLEKLKEGDTFTVTKLDRFARSLIDGTKLVQELLDRGIKINILNIGVMDNTPASKLIRNIFLSFAEFERDMILERTREGKEIAKTKAGYKEGRPKKFTKDQIDLALSMLSVNGGDKSYNEVERLIGISVSTLKRENNKRKLEKLNS